MSGIHSTRDRVYTADGVVVSAPWGDRDLVVDSFAGGGGASTGIELALGRPVDIAIDHSPEAIAMHRLNHPRTTHYSENIWGVSPKLVCRGLRVRLLWASPDCTHHSRAKGGKPRERKTRGLAWAIVRWAKEVRPSVILLENVEEFEEWGPLDDEGHPIKARKGETFRAFVRKLRGYGYRVEWRRLVAADFGDPTTRRRLFLVARCDGQPISWPQPTHGRGLERPWRSAAEIIDWSLPYPSIFGRKKPLQPATLRRIAAGVKRFVLESGAPFIVSHYGQSVGRKILAPLPTVTAGGGGHSALVVPTLIQSGYGEREGQAPRVLNLAKPLGTVVAGGQKHALVAAFLAKHYSTKTPLPGVGMESPVATVTTHDHHALMTAQLSLPGVASAQASFVSKFYGTSTGADVREPLATVTAGGQHLAEVRAFLVKYYGSSGNAESQQQSLFEPLHTVTTKACFGLVTVHGEEYVISDIGMRMLTPRELFRAQGFGDDYQIEFPFGEKGKKLSQESQIELAGNSVCVHVAEALVRANLLGSQEAAA